MYYVETKTDKYTITTSYATRMQALNYGKAGSKGITATEYHLFSLDGITSIEPYHPDHEVDCINLGRVRTTFLRNKGKQEADFRYQVFVEAASEEDAENDISRMVYTGISFSDYGEANRFIKSKSLCGEFVIVENVEIPQCQSSRGAVYSIDPIDPAFDPDEASKLQAKSGEIYD